MHGYPDQPSKGVRVRAVRASLICTRVRVRTRCFLTATAQKCVTRTYSRCISHTESNVCEPVRLPDVLPGRVLRRRGRQRHREAEQCGGYRMQG